MGYGRFDRRIQLPKQGKITIRGPFDPQDNRVEEADVLFLIVQGTGDKSVVAKGLGKWARGQHNNEWIADVGWDWDAADGTPGRLGAGVARGIALAIVVKPGKLDNVTGLSDAPTVIFDPPQIEGVTWCGDFTFV